MSTRAERRLKEATDARQKAAEAHEAAVEALAVLDGHAAAGTAVDPLDYATAEGAVKIKAKHLDTARSAVEVEQATVDEERARAAHRALVAEVKAIPEPALGDLFGSIERMVRETYAASATWEEVRQKVKDTYGEIQMTRNPGAIENGVYFSGNAFKLDGVRYTRPDPEKLVRELAERARRAREMVRSEQRRSVMAAVPNREQADIDATVEQLREDKARLNAARPAA